MLDKVFLAVFVAALLYFGFLIVTKKFTSESFDVPGSAPVITMPAPVEPPRVITPGGSNTPNQMAPSEAPLPRLPGPEDHDPYEQSYGSSNIRDNLRHPERFFGPAPQQKNVDIVLASGVAGIQSEQSAAAVQTFSPELAQNGGEYMEGGIFANDTAEDTSYSAL
jgi:hypothetical protein